eukprot:UN27869
MSALMEALLKEQNQENKKKEILTYNPEQPALRLSINISALPKAHPVVHWPTFVVVSEKQAMEEDGIKDSKYLDLLNKRESYFNGSDSESEEERQERKKRGNDSSYDSEDSFIDDNVEEAESRLRTKVGGFFVAMGDNIETLAAPVMEEPEEDKTKKRKVGKKAHQMTKYPQLYEII